MRMMLLSWLFSLGGVPSSSSSSSLPSSSGGGACRCPYYAPCCFVPSSVVALVYTILHHGIWSVTKRGFLCGTVTGSSNDSNSNSNNNKLSVAVTPTTHLQGKVALVTGSNTGIGYETARALVMDHGMTVILACRSRDKGEQAAQTINREQKQKQQQRQQKHRIAAAKDADFVVSATEGQAMFVHPLDLSSFDSVREFVQHLKAKLFPEGQKIAVLINNAGRNSSGPSSDTVSEEGEGGGGALDLLFQTNFLGHYLLTAELMHQGAFVTKAARIVNLSSVMHHFCGGGGGASSSGILPVESVYYWKQMALYQPPQNKNKAAASTYAPSKLAAILFTMELNRRYSSSHGIQSIAVNPGAVNSDIWRDFPKVIQWAQQAIYITNAQGCQTSVAAATTTIVDNNNNNNPNKIVDEGAVLIPYLQPYPVIWNPQNPAFPPLEMLGPFAGPMRTQPRLPLHDQGQRAAQALWQASLELTRATWQMTKQQQQES